MIKNSENVNMYVRSLEQPNPDKFLYESGHTISGDLSSEQLLAYDSGLQAISEGRVGVIICSGLWRKSLHFGESSFLLTKPEWGQGLTIIEHFIKRLKAIGEYGNRWSIAVQKKGKNFSLNREPIVLYIMTNDYEIEEIEDFFQRTNYCGYVGVICFANVASDKEASWPQHR